MYSLIRSSARGSALLCALACTVALLASSRTYAATPEPGHELDFWLGHWDVYAGDKLDGKDSVATSLGGFAAHEWWSDADGSKGESFFYYMPAKHQWAQVWVTGAGPYKIKYSESSPDGIRFTGKVYLADGRAFDDRTTLTRGANDTVRQRIENSRDGGKIWTLVYDAVYRRSTAR